MKTDKPLHVATLSSALLAVVLAILGLCGCSREKATSEDLVVVVTDTCAAELFCTCSPEVPKRYEALRGAMNRALGREVRFAYMTDFLFDALPEEQAQQLRGAHLIIGKCTAVEYVSARLGIKSECVGVLTRTNGSPELNGVWVAKAEGGARGIGDLAGKRISIGPVWQAEKHGDALEQLAAQKVKPGEVTERLLCKEALADVVDGEADAAVISDYATALLADKEVTRGTDLTVIGQTPGRPHVGVFATNRLSAAEARAVSEFLLRGVAGDSELLEALKSKRGFVPLSAGKQAGGVAANTQ